MTGLEGVRNDWIHGVVLKTESRQRVGCVWKRWGKNAKLLPGILALETKREGNQWHVLRWIRMQAQCGA